MFKVNEQSRGKSRPFGSYASRQSTKHNTESRECGIRGMHDSDMAAQQRSVLLVGTRLAVLGLKLLSQQVVVYVTKNVQRRWKRSPTITRNRMRP